VAVAVAADVESKTTVAAVGVNVTETAEAGLITAWASSFWHESNSTVKAISASVTVTDKLNFTIRFIIFFI
jgi:hypothetical protein